MSIIIEKRRTNNKRRIKIKEEYGIREFYKLSEVEAEGKIVQEYLFYYIFRGLSRVAQTPVLDFTGLGMSVDF